LPNRNSSQKTGRASLFQGVAAMVQNSLVLWCGDGLRWRFIADHDRPEDEGKDTKQDRDPGDGVENG